MLSAHESKYFEWLAWAQGEKILNEVPSESKKRLEWLASYRKFEVNDKMAKILKKWYREEHTKQVKIAEAFETCEHRNQPTDEGIKKPFPMMEQ